MSLVCPRGGASAGGERVGESNASGEPSPPGRHRVAVPRVSAPSPALQQDLGGRGHEVEEPHIVVGGSLSSCTSVWDVLLTSQA